MTAVNVKTGEEVSLFDVEDIAVWIERRKAEKCKFIFHNGLGYDAPTLNRLLGTGLLATALIDTMLMSMLYSPSLDGGHSPPAWGQRLRFPKGQHTDLITIGRA